MLKNLVYGNKGQAYVQDAVLKIKVLLLSKEIAFFVQNVKKSDIIFCFLKNMPNINNVFITITVNAKSEYMNNGVNYRENVFKAQCVTSFILPFRHTMPVYDAIYDSVRFIYFVA